MMDTMKKNKKKNKSESRYGAEASGGRFSHVLERVTVALPCEGKILYQSHKYSVHIHENRYINIRKVVRKLFSFKIPRGKTYMVGMMIFLLQN